MIDILLSVGGKLTSLGIDMLEDHINKKKKEEAALITIEKLNQQMVDMNKKWIKLISKLERAQSPKFPGGTSSPKVASSTFTF